MNPIVSILIQWQQHDVKTLELIRGRDHVDTRQAKLKLALMLEHAHEQEAREAA